MPTAAGTPVGPDDLVVAAIGVAAGVATLIIGSRPTGSLSVDIVLTIAGVTGAVWATARCRWWALAATGAIAATLAGELWATGLGVTAFMIALAVGMTELRVAVASAASGGLSAVALATIGDLHRFGLSAVVAIGLMAACGAVGLSALPPPTRRTAVLALAGAAAVAVIAMLGLGLAAFRAKADLSEGDRSARRGLELTRRGEFDEARRHFETSAKRFRRAASEIRRPWAQLARLVPLAAQHRSAAQTLSESAMSATRTLAVELGAVDLEALRIVDGRIDIDGVRSMQGPMDRVNAAVELFDQSVRGARSGWLAPPVAGELDDLIVELAEQQSIGSRASDALAVAPAMLGENGERVYFVMFTTPAEARGQGGFMGNYAELTVADGEISMSAFGRHGDLNLDGARPRVLTDAPTDWLERYGPFGFTTGPGGTPGEQPWSNITMSPNFPSTAQVVAGLYPQSGGRPIDGVMSLDVFALEQIIGLVGPIDVAGVPVPLTVDNAASFLLVGQYEIAEPGARVDLLEQVARDTFDRLLGDSAPDPLDLGRALHPMAQERRLMAWSRHPDEAALITATGLDGALLSDLGDDDGIAITVVNASGNKIDTFLHREYELTRVAGTADELELRIEFRNEPPMALPDYVVGNLVGLPRGWSRLFLSIHTTMALESAMNEAGTLGLQPSIEGDIPVYSGYVDIAPHDDATLWVRLVPGSLTLKILPQPLVAPEQWNSMPLEVAQRIELATLGP